MASSSADSITIQCTITATSGAPRVPVTLSLPMTATALRRRVCEVTRIPLTALRLIYRGRLIPDNDATDVVSEFQLEEGSVLHCMGKPETVESASVTKPVSAMPSVAVSAPAVTPAATSSETALNLPSALQQMRAANTPAVYSTGLTTLNTILANVIAHPREEKYRTLKIQNPAFQRRLGGITGGDVAIRACGFIVITNPDGERAYSMTPTPEQWMALLQSKSTLEQAMRQAAISTVPSTANRPAPPPSSPLPWNGALPTFGGSSQDFSNAPEMRQMFAELASNPQQMQAMLQNPMIQTILRNDPQFANDPVMSQVVEGMFRNPEVISHMSQLISDPTIQNIVLNDGQDPEATRQFRERNMLNDPRIQQFEQSMQQLLRDGRAAPQGPLIDPVLIQQFQSAMQGRQAELSPAVNGTNPPSGGARANSSSNDAEMTEEEMIAEAIRRSLQDNNNNGGNGS